MVVAGALVPFVALGEGQKTTTVITSKRMTASNETNQAIFQDNVKMVRGELIVHSDIMIVHFKDKASSPSSPSGQPSPTKSKKEIRFIEAKGRVKIQNGESRATCQHAVYYTQEEKVILKGSPVAWQGGTRISGPKMTMFFKEYRSIVEGGTQVIIEESEEN